ITERHARRVQSILDTAFDAIFTFDRFGRARSANRAAEALLRQPFAEFERAPFQRIFTWSSAGAPSTSAASESNGPGARPLQWPPPGAAVAGAAGLADGPTIPGEFSLGLSGEGDELVYTAIVRDVRDRVEAERRIKESAEGLENSNRRLAE